MSKSDTLNLELTQDDMAGEFPVRVNLDRSRPLTKKELAFKKKLVHRIKEVQRFLGRPISTDDMNAISRTLTKELNEQ